MITPATFMDMQSLGHISAKYTGMMPTNYIAGVMFSFTFSQFSSRWHYVLRKVHVCVLYPIFQKFPIVAFVTVPVLSD